jgi:mannose-6-phosphate isomerase
MTPLYPLLFKENFHERVWGGNRLRPLKGLAPNDEKIGESWEISAIPGSESIVANGELAGRSLNELIAEYRELFVGKQVYKQFGNTFPLLIKFIDAASDLSIQVHPNDALAKERHNCFGKTEMWYLMDAAPGAFLYSGFSTPISKYEYEKRIEDSSICEVLKSHQVKSGDVFFIPAGRVHAIGGGVMVAEIQQSSDITYRIFDYNRPGLDGKPRTLHTEEAKNALDYTVLPDYRTHYEQKTNKPMTIVDCPYFTTKMLNVNRPFHRKLYKYDSFVIYMCLMGDCKIRLRSWEGFPTRPSVTEVNLTKGNSCLVPAGVADFEVTPNNSQMETKVLEVYIDNKNYVRGL